MEGMPMPRKDWSEFRPTRLPSSLACATSSTARAATPTVCGMEFVENSSASIAPRESTLTWTRQCWARSNQKLSAYQSEDEYRPWEGPDHIATRNPRRRSYWRGASRRATSSIVAFALPLSIAPAYQLSKWPEKRMNPRSASGWPGVRSARTSGVFVHFVSTAAVKRAYTRPRRQRSRRTSPSAAATERRCTRGSSATEVDDGFPHTGEQHIS